MIAILIHGGAGDWAEADREAAVQGVGLAAVAGWDILASGGSALDAVTAAVIYLEDDPGFNAGTGSVLNAAGDVEMDASIMDGDTLASGGVACLTRVRNPILVARRVLESTDCVLLAGENATSFARAQGFEDHDPVTARRREQWRAGGAAPAPEPPGTVGAVALDALGNLAAATSTGGRARKMPGRVGDSPIPGAGNLANAHAAVSATGHGELMLRYGTAREIAARIEGGASAQDAASHVLKNMELRFGIPIGVICVDVQGRLGIVNGTASMPHAYRRAGDAGVTARFAT